MRQIKLFKLLFPFLLLSFSSATTLKEAIEHTLANNPEVKSLEMNTKAYYLYIDEQEAGYYPKIDLDIYLENKEEIKNLATGVETTVHKNGFNAQLSVNQMLYDGGLTSSKVDEARHDYQKTKLGNFDTIENVIYETTQTYLDTVKYQELLILASNNLAIHNSYLEIAEESEEVSGETLDRIQVESKLYLAISKLFQQKNESEDSVSSFNKLVGYEPKGFICRPSINHSLIPAFEEAKTLSMQSSFAVLEKIQEIKKQRAVISQEKSRYMPTLNFELRKEFDDDLDTKDTRADISSAKLIMSYNLFNGGADKASNERERIFLQESQKTLDDTMGIVEESLRNAYAGFTNSKDKIIYLKLYVKKNKEVLAVYKEQFLGGTRTFIDILNAEAELYNAKTQLIEEEYSLIESYYEILLTLSNLSNTIVLQDKQICKQIEVDLEPKPLERKSNKEGDADLKELEGLLEDDAKSDELTSLEDNIDKEAEKENKVKALVSEILSEVYDIDISELSKDELSIEEALDDEKSTDVKEIGKEKIIQNKPKEEEPAIIQKKKQSKDSESVEKINIDDNQNIDTKVVDEPVITNDLESEFNSTKSKKFTIMILDFKDRKKARSFAKVHKLYDNGLIFKVYSRYKVVYGLFDTYSDATKAMKNLKPFILKNKPYVRKISGYQKVYKKYFERVED